MATWDRTKGRGVLAAVFKDKLEADGCASYRRSGRGKGVLKVRLPSTEPGVLQQTNQDEKLTYLPDVGKPVLKCSSNESTKSSKSQGGAADQEVLKQGKSRYLVMCYSYQANKNRSGGFTELSAKKGEYLEFLCEHPDNEHWWQARNEDGEIGYVPSSYVILKEDEVLPWLEQSALERQETERQERLARQSQQQALNEGRGFGPPPKTKPTASAEPYVYVSAYDRNTPQNKISSTMFSCELCNKTFNGPQPYKAHMASRSHREEVQLRAEEQY